MLFQHPNCGCDQQVLFNRVTYKKVLFNRVDISSLESIVYDTLLVLDDVLLPMLSKKKEERKDDVLLTSIFDSNFLYISGTKLDDFSNRTSIFKM